MKRRIRARFDELPDERRKLRKLRIFAVKIIDGVDEQVEWGEAVFRPPHSWVFTRDGKDAAIRIEAATVDEARRKLEQILDDNGGAK